MVVFGYAGYWAHKWELRADELIALKQAEIAERKLRDVARLEALATDIRAEGQ
jgi:hypothetical protein